MGVFVCNSKERKRKLKINENKEKIETMPKCVTQIY